MSKTRQEIIEQLNAKIPRSDVRERQGGGGRTFSYLEGHYVINLLNEILGQGNWEYQTDEIRCVHVGDQSVHYIAKVSLTATLPQEEGKSRPFYDCTFSDVGYGDGIDRNNIGKAHELAAKEAVTDALKRCAKNLGMRLGLALYSKDQENVQEEESVHNDGKGAVGNAPKVSKPAAMGPVHSKPAQTVSPRTTESRGAPSQEETLKLISNYAKVVTAKRAMSVNQIKEEMSKRYGVDTKEKLNSTQASEFMNFLKEKAYANQVEAKQ